MTFFKALSLGFDALGIALAVQAKNPEMLAHSITTLLIDIGETAKIKEMDRNFIMSLSNDIRSLTEKIIAHVGE
jgi:hypothetical protein